MGRIHRVAASAQTGLAFLFVVVAVLFVRATGVMEERELGFSPDPLLVTQLDLSREGYASSEEGRLFVTRLAEAVGSVPGVASATVADGLPLDLIGNYTAVRRADMADEPGGRVRVEFTRATEGYFETIGTPILQGRGIEATDDESSEPVVVVTQSLASRLWPGETALGRRVSIPLGLDSARTYTVAGVVAHTASSRAREDWPHVFFALRQTYRPRIMIIARAAGDPAALVEPVRSAILGVDPGLPHPGFILGSGLVERALQPQRNTISLAGAFGVLALLLSAIGVYGVVSFSVVSRTREIGLRMAMGASKSRVLAEVFRDAVKLAIPGLMVGAVLGAAMAASMGRFLLGISPVDPLSMLTSAGVLFAVVVLASLVPARRASSIQPMRALGRE